MFFELAPGGSRYRFAVNEDNLLYQADLPQVEPVRDEESEIARSLEHPIASLPLASLAGPGTKVVIVADDLTRPTPQARILPLILNRLNALGVRDEDITVVIGLGTHRAMDEAEVCQRFGADVMRRVRIVNHDFKDPACLVRLGVTAQETVVEVNRLVYEADLRILVGTVIPHPYAGWGGGAKMIQPGVCSEQTTEGTHVAAGTYPDLLALPGRADNPIRQEIESVADKLGPLFIVNTVQDREGRLIRCFAGHHVAAHREAVKVAERAFRPLIPERTEIVVCSAHPCDRDYWQGFKAFFYAHLGLRKGGVIVFALAAPEGIAGDAPSHAHTIRTWGAKETEEILAALESGMIEDRIAGSMCVAHSRLLRRARVFSVSTGMDETDQRALGFEPYDSLDQALAAAFRIVGPHAKVGVIPNGGETLVRVGRDGAG